jgi:hypothetical protein
MEVIEVMPFGNNLLTDRAYFIGDSYWRSLDSLTDGGSNDQITY